jgi:hypothetical protein
MSFLFLNLHGRESDSSGGGSGNRGGNGRGHGVECDDAGAAAKQKKWEAPEWNNFLNQKLVSKFSYMYEHFNTPATTAVRLILGQAPHLRGPP